MFATTSNIALHSSIQGQKKTTTPQLKIYTRPWKMAVVSLYCYNVKPHRKLNLSGILTDISSYAVCNVKSQSIPFILFFQIAMSYLSALLSWVVGSVLVTLVELRPASSESYMSVLHGRNTDLVGERFQKLRLVSRTFSDVFRSFRTFWRNR